MLITKWCLLCKIILYHQYIEKVEFGGLNSEIVQPFESIIVI